MVAVCFGVSVVTLTHARCMPDKRPAESQSFKDRREDYRRTHSKVYRKVIKIKRGLRKEISQLDGGGTSDETNILAGLSAPLPKHLGVSIATERASPLDLVSGTKPHRFASSIHRSRDPTYVSKFTITYFWLSKQYGSNGN